MAFLRKFHEISTDKKKDFAKRDISWERQDPKTAKAWIFATYVVHTNFYKEKVKTIIFNDMLTES